MRCVDYGQTLVVRGSKQCRVKTRLVVKEMCLREVWLEDSGDGKSPGTERLKSGALSELHMVLDTMLLKSLSRSGPGSVVNHEHNAERKVRYLNSFLTTAGIMLRCFRRMTMLLVKLGPGGMSVDALLSLRNIKER